MSVQDQFEGMLDNHKEILIEAAQNGNEEIWVNMCNIYKFEVSDRAKLKRYLLSGK